VAKIGTTIGKFFGCCSGVVGKRRDHWIRGGMKERINDPLERGGLITLSKGPLDRHWETLSRESPSGPYKRKKKRK